MNRKQWLVAALGAAALAGAIGWALREPPVPVETAEVRRGSFVQTIDEDGRTRVRERYVVSAPVAGRLARVRVKAGDPVRAGATLAVLWPAAPAMIDARTARELAERIGAAQALVEQARARAAGTEAAFEQARADAARQRRLRDEGFVAAAALDQAELAERVAERERDAARFAAAGAAHDLAQARATLTRAREGAQASRPGSAWEIVSPVDGQVLRVLQESETTLALGTPLVEVGDPADLEVVIDVLSTERSRIADGARVVLDSGNGAALEGRVRRVEPAAFTKVSALGVEEQRVNVIVDLVSPRNQWHELGDRFRIDARIVAFERRDAVLAPVSALLRDGEHWAVYVAEDGRAVKRRVRVGARSPLDAWIEQGLAPGERVIVYPGDSVAEGRRIETVRGPA